MTDFAFIDPEGFPTGGGSLPDLPEGAVALTAPYTTLDLSRLVYRDGAWSVRPALPVAVVTEDGFSFDGLPPEAVVTVIDQGLGGAVVVPRGIASAFASTLPHDG